MLKDGIRFAITVLLFAMVGAALYYLFINLGTAPLKDDEGNIIVDTHANAKDALLVVLPLLSVALGYWFGVRGQDQATQQAAVAQTEAADAKAQVAAIRAAADPAAITEAETSNPGLTW